MRRESPPLISRTNCTFGPPSIVLRSFGMAFSWIWVMVPDGSANNISSGISVFFIQNWACFGAGKTNSIPAALAIWSLFISPTCCSLGSSATSTAKFALVDCVEISSRSAWQAACAPEANDNATAKISAVLPNPKPRLAPPFCPVFRW